MGILQVSSAQGDLNWVQRKSSLQPPRAAPDPQTERRPLLVLRDPEADDPLTRSPALQRGPPHGGAAASVKRSPAREYPHPPHEPTLGGPLFAFPRDVGCRENDGRNG